MDPGVDVLEEALEALRIRGSLLLRETYPGAFAVEVPPAEALAPLLGVRVGERAVAFHLAEAGSFELREGGETRVVEAGELTFCFGGGAHRLLGRGRARVRKFSELLETEATDVYQAPARERSDGPRILCGALVLSDTVLNPLFDALPGVLHVGRGAGAEETRVRAFVALLVAELERGDPASEYVLRRLLEVLCAEGLRAHLERADGDADWFRVLADPALHRAVAAFHARPGFAWTVAELARHANLSPSRFAARFSEASGTSVMSYVTRWRMNLATRRLAYGEETLGELAYDLGYESLPAFSRTFKKLVGEPPASYRKARRPHASRAS